MDKMTNGEKSHLAKSIISDKDGKPRKLDHIRIEPADNGFVVETHHKKPDRKGKDGEAMPSYEHEVKRTVFNSHKEAADHCADCMETHAKSHMGGNLKAATQAASDRDEMDR